MTQCGPEFKRPRDESPLRPDMTAETPSRDAGLSAPNRSTRRTRSMGATSGLAYAKEGPRNGIRLGLDTVGCEKVPDCVETPCRLECCAARDECYRNSVVQATLGTEVDLFQWLRLRECITKVGMCWSDAAPRRKMTQPSWFLLWQAGPVHQDSRRLSQSGLGREGH
jgi:hypothetical protein